MHGRGYALALPTPYPAVTIVVFPAATVVDSATVPASYREYVADLEDLYLGVLFVRCRVHLACGSRSRPRLATVLRTGYFGAGAHPGAVVLRRLGYPAVTLGVPLGLFTDKLPSSRVLTKGQIDQDLTEGRAISRSLCAGSTVETALPMAGARGWCSCGARYQD